MDYNSMAYGFIFTICGAVVGATVINWFLREKENVWKARYNLLKEMHDEQYRMHKDIVESFQTAIKGLKLPNYIQCTIVHEDGKKDEV